MKDTQHHMKSYFYYSNNGLHFLSTFSVSGMYLIVSSHNPHCLHLTDKEMD